MTVGIKELLLAFLQYNKTAFNGKRLQFLSCRWMEKLGGEREMLPGFFILVGQF